MFELEKQVNEMKKARSVKERVGTVKSQWDLKQGLSARKRITMGTSRAAFDSSLRSNSLNDVKEVVEVLTGGNVHRAHWRSD